MEEFKVTFKPHNKSVRVARGGDLLTAALKCGIVLHSSCGGEGLCGKCKVIIKSGDIRTEPSDILSDDDKKRGVRLACETIVEGNLEVFIPPESVEVMDEKRSDAEEFSKGVISKRENVFPHHPLIERIYVELPKPDSDEGISDLDRIYKAIENKNENQFVSTRLSNLRLLSEILRESNFKVTVTVSHNDGVMEIIAIEPGDTSNNNFGFAFDIGTTTVAGQLIDINKREVLGTRIAYNKQAKFGGDIISRIIYGSTSVGLEKLSELVIKNINEIASDLARENNIDMSKAYSVVCAGNMAMMHFLFKVDPTHIRKAPYIPTTTDFPIIHSSETGININPKGLLYSFPGVATYLGGDIVSGIIASGLFEDTGISILADIGTNGEIVVGNNEWMVGAAASAGPAFEGSALSCGMKAVKGAIEKIKIGKDFKVAFETIGGEKAKGICGSGYIDLLREMLKSGIIDRDGRIKADAAPSRVRLKSSLKEFIVVFKKESATGQDIVITEDDIENLKRAKGAIYSAIIALLNKVGKNISEVKRIYVAGGFGNYIGIENAISIGLLPDVERSVYQYIGNSSLAGARMALSSREALMKAKDVSKGITYIDLSSESGYMDEYIAALFFPHTDLGRFPSVKL